MKITYILRTFPSLSETFVLNQITGLIDKGHGVNIISIDRPTEENVHEDVLRYDLLSKTLYLRKTPFALEPGLKQGLFLSLSFTDMLHAHFASLAADLAMLLSKVLGIPYIFTAHANDIFTNIDIRQLKERSREAAGIVTVSDYNRNYLLKILGADFSSKIRVIRCGINLDDFEFVERQSDKIIKILLVGRLTEKKGVPDAVAGFKKALENARDIEMRIVGEGELKENIQAIINRSGLNEKVFLLGAQPRERIVQEIRKADIFFLPSATAKNGDREGIPVSIMEAMATGLPVVSTLHTGIPELVINGKTGFLVKEHDITAMAEKISTLALSPGLRNEMGVNGSEYVKAHYNSRNEINELECLFAELAGKDPGHNRNKEACGQAFKEKFEHVLGLLEQDFLQKEFKNKQIRKLVEAAKKNRWVYRLYYILKPFLKKQGLN